MADLIFKPLQAAEPDELVFKPLTDKAEETTTPEEPKKITTLRGTDKDNGFITDALDFIKQISAPVIGGIPAIPRGIEQGARGILRASAEGEPSSIMPSSVYNPALDTEETLFGPETGKQIAQRKLGAQRVMAQIPEIPGLKEAANIGHKATENIQKSISPQAKKAIKESTPEGNIFKGELSFGKNPSLYGYALQGANVFGSMLPVIVGTMVTRNPNTGAVIGAGMAADEAASNAADTINKLSDKQLAEQSPFYAQMLQGGASPKEARDLTIRKAAETGAKLQGIVAAFGDKFTGHLISGAFDNMIEKLTGKSILAKAAGTGAVSSLEEGTQETGEGVASNVGLQSVLPNTELGEGSAANFALGALGGAGPGAVRGAVSGIQGKLAGQEETPTEPYTPAQPQTSAANTYQMPAGQQPIVPTVLQREQQLKQTINPPVPSATSAQGTLTPYHPEFGEQIDPETGEILKKEQQLKQIVENPTLYTRPDEHKNDIQKLQTSILNAPIAGNIDPETGEITPAKAVLPEQKQRGVRIDPETGEIIEDHSALNALLAKYGAVPVGQPLPIATPAATPAPVVDKERQTKIDTETARLVKSGFPADAAKNMAEKKVDREAKAPKVENVTRPNAQSVGTSVQTSEQPTAVQGTTEGTQGTERNGVVPNKPNAPSGTAGEGTKPTAVKETSFVPVGFAYTVLESPAYEGQKPLSLEDADFELEALQLSAEKGRMSPQRFAESEIGKRLDTTQVMKVNEGLRTDPVKTIQDLRNSIQQKSVTKNKEDLEQQQAPELSDEEIAAKLKAEQTKETPELTDEEIAARLKEQALKEEQERTKAEQAKEKRGKGRPTHYTDEERGAVKEENKPVNAEYNKAKRDLKKFSAQLDYALAPVSDELTFEEAKDEEETKRHSKVEAIRELQKHLNNPNLRGRAITKKIAAILNDRSKISQRELDDIKKGTKTAQQVLADKSFIHASTGPTQSRVAPKSVGKENADFGKAKNLQEALKIVSKTGTKFEKFIANKLAPLLKNVRFVVIEEGQPLPAEVQGEGDDGVPYWSKTVQGMYVEYPTKNKKAVFVRGGGSEFQGINNTTVLHEAWHAATNMKINIARVAIYMGENLNTPIVKAYQDFKKLILSTKDRFERQQINGMPTKELLGVQQIQDNGNIFEDPREFLAYAMTDEDLQGFLMKSKSIFGLGSKWNDFVDIGRRLLGIPTGMNNALSDMLVISDSFLNAVPTAQEESDALDAIYGPTAQKAKVQTAKLKAVVSKGEKAVAKSEAGRELSANLSTLQLLRNPSYIWDSVQANWAGLSDSARKFISHAYDSEALAYGGPGSVIQELKNTHKLMQRMSGMVQIELTKAAKQADAIVDFFRESPELRKTFENLVNGTTIDQYDPSKPQTKKNATYDTWYASLGQKGQDVYNGLKQYYSDMRDYQQHLLEEQIIALNLPKQEESKLLKALQLKYQSEHLVEPYFPLMRYGDYVLEFGKGANRSVIRYETLSERNLAAIRQAKKMGKTLATARNDGSIKISNDIGSTKLRSTIEGTSELLKAVYESIEAANLQAPGAAAALKDDVYQAYISAMPEQSVRKLFMHRTGVAGFSPDILKNVNNMGIKMSSQFSKLKYGAPLRNSLQVARNQLEGKEEYTPFVARMAEFVGESISPTPKSDLASYGDIVAGALTKLSFLHYMTSWSSAMLQPLDIFMKGVPILTGSHGPKAVAEISKVLAVWNTFGITEKQPDGTVRFNAPSIKYAKGLTADQQRAIADLHAFDVTRSTLTNEVFNQAKTPVSKVDSKGIAVAKLAGRTLILGGLMHHGERLSREVIYLASYNLTRAEGIKEGLQPGENYKEMLERVHNEAVDKAVQETNETFGNYSAYNRPMIMRGALGKIATQFKFFPLVTSKLLVGNFFKMLPLMNKEGKIEAATKFFGIMATHLLFGGLVALPAFSAVMGMLGAAWRRWGKDKDAPDDMKSLDYETWYRTVHLKELLGDTWIGDLSELAERGLLNKLTGLDISNRISLNDLWFRDPVPGKDLKSSVQNWGMTLGGAGVNYALSFAKGLQSIGNGDYEQGMEAISPGSISGLIAAHREAREGIKNNQGHTLVEKGKVGAGVIAGQAVGFKSDIAQSRQNAIFKTDAVDRQIYLERQNILDKIKEYKLKSMDEDKGKAYQDRFESKYEDALDRVTDFNERNPEKKVTGKEIKEALLGHLKKFGAAEGNEGMTINKKNARLAEPIRETLEKREPK